MSLEQNENTSNQSQIVGEENMFFDANIVETTNYVGMSLVALGILLRSRSVPSSVLFKPYDTKEDFDWFTSGQVETESFKGLYIAIWKKQIVGSGETPLEAERIAKAYHGDDCRPAVVYISNDDEVDTIF